MSRPEDCLPLVAACDVLTLRCLEVVGKRTVRSQRSRYGQMQGKPWHVAHTLWQPEPEVVEKALSDAWVMLPDLLDRWGCLSWDTAQLALVLDRYVRDVCHAMRPHDPDDLAYRLGAVVAGVS